MQKSLLTMLLSLIISFTAVAQEAYAVYNNGTLTFYYDKQKSSRSGTKYSLNTGTNDPGWYTDHAKDIKKAVFTSSFSGARPTSTYRWFAVNNYSENSNLANIIGLQYLNTSLVTTMSYMFYRCILTSLDVSKFNTSNVMDMSGMFSRSRLTSLDLSNFNTANVTDMVAMFYDCSSLKTIYADEAKWSTDKVTEGNNVFLNCTNLVGGAGTKYDTNHINKEYAHIDGGRSNPGYLTDKNTATTEDEVCDADDAQRWIDNLTSNEPTEMVFCDEPTIDDDVEVDDAQIWIDGTDNDPQIVIMFIGGAINIHQNAGMSFKAVTFADKDAAVAALLRTAGGNGGIRNSGALAFENCTFREGSYTIENSGTDHIQMSLPTGYAYKYDATVGGIVVYSTTGITTLEQQKTVIESYDVTGRKADKESKGLRIQRMSDGTIQKTF